MNERKKSLPEIKLEIYKRLLHYGQSPKLKKIHQLVEADPKAKMTILGGKGWVTIDWIEKKPCPYGSPRSHRHKYLKDDLIEKETIIYIVKKKPTDPHRNQYTETLYRLKRDKNTYKKIIKLIDIQTLANSKYFKEATFYNPGGWHGFAWRNALLQTKPDKFTSLVETYLEHMHFYLVIQRENPGEEYPEENYAVALLSLNKLQKLIKSQKDYDLYKVKRKLETLRKQKALEGLKQAIEGFEPET